MANKEGIFPLTHVIELEIPKLLRQRSKSVHGKELLFARALCDSVAQLDEELGFQAGDIISVIEVLDADWYIGELGSKQGMFLSSCVELLNEEIDDTSPQGTTQTPSPSPKTMFHNDEPNFDLSQEIGPMGISYTSENTKSHDGSVTPYARTLYQFIGEMSNELSFNANDIVTLIQHVDDHWIEGELDGKIGIFPSNYVEIIVNCPSMSETEPPSMQEILAAPVQHNIDNTSASISESKPTSISSSFEMPSVERYGLVRHGFQAQAKGDLNLNEGDTITIVKQIDGNWYQARDENGNEGICPVEFVELIAIEPDFDMPKSKSCDDIETTSCDKNFQRTIGIHIEGDVGENDCKEASTISKNDSSHFSERITFSDSLKNKSMAPSHLPPRSYSVDVNKPVIKPKPKLLPKPVIKHKPVLVKHKVPPAVPEKLTPSVTLANDENKASQNNGISDSMSRSDSCHAFTQNLNIDSIASVHRASSMSTLDNADANDCKYRTKMVGNVDCNLSLDSVIQQEFRRSSVSSHGSSELNSPIPEENKETEVISFKGKNSWNSARFDSRSNSVQIDFTRAVESYGTPSMGMNHINSSSEFTSSKQTKALPMRKPPSIPHRTESVDISLERQPSLRKAAPPRPTGPRLAAAPSIVPLTPTKAIPVPQRAAPPPPPPPSTTPVPLSLSAEKTQPVNKRLSTRPQKPILKPPPPEVRPKSMFYVNGEYCTFWTYFVF